MASNTQLDASTTTGDKIVTKQISHDGDTAKLQQVSLMVVSGTEDAYTAVDAPGGAGAVTSGTPRVTLASDDPAVASLAAIDAGKLEEATFTGRIGEVQASPTANTLLARLKDLLTGIVLAAGTNLLGKVGIDQVTANANEVVVKSGALTDTELRATAVPVSGTVTASGPLTDTQLRASAVPVSAASLPLPSGAATATLQGGGLPAALGAGGGLKIDGSGTSVPVSAASLPLPTGAATETTLAAIDAGKLEEATFTDRIGEVSASPTANTVLARLKDLLSLVVLAAGDNNIGNVDIASAIPAGTNAIGKLAANSGVDIGDVDVTSIAAGANLIGDVGLQPRTSGGLSFSKLISAATTNLTQVKATAGQVYAIYATNINAAIRYLKLYNLASASVTVGTTVPDLTLPIPANAAGAGFFLKWPQGVAFSVGISFALTTGVADNDLAAVAANELTVHFFYK